VVRPPRPGPRTSPGTQQGRGLPCVEQAGAVSGHPLRVKAVAVATPESRCRKFRATRSPRSKASTGPDASPTLSPGATRTPSGTKDTVTDGSTWRNTSSATGPPQSTPSAQAMNAPDPSAGNELPKGSPEGASSRRAARTVSSYSERGITKVPADQVQGSSRVSKVSAPAHPPVPQCVHDVRWRVRDERSFRSCPATRTARCSPSRSPSAAPRSWSKSISPREGEAHLRYR